MKPDLADFSDYKTSTNKELDTYSLESIISRNIRGSSL